MIFRVESVRIRSVAGHISRIVESVAGSAEVIGGCTHAHTESSCCALCRIDLREVTPLIVRRIPGGAKALSPTTSDAVGCCRTTRHSIQVIVSKCLVQSRRYVVRDLTQCSV